MAPLRFDASLAAGMKKSSETLKLFGIFGHPLGHTLSPAMQETAFEFAGEKARYLVFDLSLKDFQKTMAVLSRLPLEGFNLTVPYKQAVIPFLQGLTPEARAVGAVNTVFRKGVHKWVGANTDVQGFLRSLEQEGRFNVPGKSAFVFGAGGAARAVVYGLASRNAKKIIITARRENRARVLCREFGKVFVKTEWITVPWGEEKFKEHIKTSDLVINATPLGLNGKDAGWFSPGLIPAGGGRKILFYDLIYNPAQTPFLKAAAQKGHRTLGGLGMLLFQGAAAYELWTRKKAPVCLMRLALERALRERD